MLVEWIRAKGLEVLLQSSERRTGLAARGRRARGWRGISCAQIGALPYTQMLVWPTKGSLRCMLLALHAGTDPLEARVDWQVTGSGWPVRLWRDNWNYRSGAKETEQHKIYGSKSSQAPSRRTKSLAMDCWTFLQLTSLLV